VIALTALLKIAHQWVDRHSSIQPTEWLDESSSACLNTRLASCWTTTSPNNYTAMVLTATKIIDGRDHLLGRLCSIVAKELLAGQTIVIVRCDEVCISGSRKFDCSNIVAVSSAACVCVCAPNDSFSITGRLLFEIVVF